LPPPRPFALVRTIDQWCRSSHADTFVEASAGEVSLAWEHPQAEEAGAPLPGKGAGLAFDAACLLYHSVPDEARVERLRWAAVDPFAPDREQPQPVNLIGGGPPLLLGEFAPATRDTGLREPRALVVDEDDRLFVADAAAGTVFVYDLWSRRLLRRVAPAGPDGLGQVPLDLACRGRTVWLLVDGPPGLYRMEARRGPVPAELPGLPAGAVPLRLSVAPDGAVVVLARDAAGVGWIVAAGADAIGVQDATDLEFDGDGVLVVARAPGADFARLGEGFEALPLKARGYDGLGIARTPDGRIGFWTGEGFRHAVTARVRYAPAGRVTTYRLDSGAHQTQWGRLFVEACIPEGTDVRVHTATGDETSDQPAIPRRPPGNLVGRVIRRPDLSPPMPPAVLAPGDGDVVWPLHRRETGRELPWARPAEDDPFETYEAPIEGDPGRYLWVTLELSGNRRSTPRVRSVRAEHPSHDLVRRLPRSFSRDATTAAFLRRYLAMFDGTLGELEGRAAARHGLLDPMGAPQEVLPWLASFVGLVLDEQWPPPAKRTLVEEAAWLFRFRGTVAGLRRLLEIYLRTTVVIVEQFRLRGLGGTVGAGTGPILSSAILGGGFRVGGAIGEPGIEALDGTVDDAFRSNAHRFSVVITAVLKPEQFRVVQDLLDTHRPAHTIVELCTVGAGMRVGQGLHLGLSSIIGRTGGFTELRAGGSVLGRGGVVGRPVPGARLGSARVGDDSRLG
jgi:phage tail-like protein